MINTLNKNLTKLGISFNSEDYNFLETNSDLHTPILIVLGGSYAYGTNIPTSDLDIRGIAMHSSRDILLNKGFEQIVNESDKVFMDYFFFNKVSFSFYNFYKFHLKIFYS